MVAHHPPPARCKPADARQEGGQAQPEPPPHARVPQGRPLSGSAAWSAEERSSGSATRLKRCMGGPRPKRGAARRSSSQARRGRAAQVRWGSGFCCSCSIWLHRARRCGAGAARAGRGGGGGGVEVTGQARRAAGEACRLTSRKSQACTHCPHQVPPGIRQARLLQPRKLARQAPGSPARRPLNSRPRVTQRADCPRPPPRRRRRLWGRPALL